MKIAININELTLKQNSGVKTYTREIVKALREVDDENEYLLYASCNCSGQACLSATITKQNSKFNKPFWTYLKFPQEIKRDKPNVLFMPIQATPFLKKPKNIKLVITVHDLAFLLFPKHFTFKDRLLLNFHTKRAVQMADKIIVPSLATKNDIIKFYGIDEGKIEVVYHGVPTNNKKEPSSEASELGSFLLFVGTIQPRKNIIKLIEAFELLKTKYQIPNTKCNLIIVGGRGWMADKIYKRAKESEFSDQIIFKGSVSDNELANLYKNAAIFVMPSLYEGFGLPVLEAMSYGIPCVVSDNSSFKEITRSGQACLSTTGDAKDIAEKISILLNNEKLREKLSLKGVENARRFSWTESARRMVEIFGK